MSFTEYVSQIWLPDCSKLAVNWENDNDISIFQHVIVNSLWCCFISLVKFSYWSKFHVNFITCSRVMTISFYNGLTKNLEIRNTPVWILPNTWRLGQVRNTTFGTNISNKMLLNASNARVTAFTVSELLKENQEGGGGKITPHPPIHPD